MGTLKELGIAITTSPVTINGRMVQARTVGSAESEALRKLYPRPVVRPEHEFDPTCMAAETAWLNRFAKLKAAVALGLSGGAAPNGGTLVFVVGMADSELKAWAEAVLADIGQNLTDVQINRINEAANDAAAEAQAKAPNS